jgi:peptide chain release factor 3
MSELDKEIANRRTFAIISHPDAGKTTLTEKLLLYSGMIRTAGMVRGRKGGQLATSDWMEMEQERGISITASAMQFPYKEATINVLDTPGHQDFSEDTYRTLTAADSAIMVIDAAKGVEAQTRKLFQVCRTRRIPVLTLINKMDLPGRDPLSLMSEVEEVLGIHAVPMNWPIGSGREFAGVVDRRTRQVILFARAGKGGSMKAIVERFSIDDERAAEHVDPELLKHAREEMELHEHAGTPFSITAFRKAEITPMFFGSALTNFGIEPFFDAFIELAPCPGARHATADDGRDLSIDPATEPFSGFVFKLQANMNPRHRDSMAFLRVCSGKFERGLVVKHHRLEKTVRLSRPHSMMSGERSTIDVAYPGDIVGIVNPGTFAIGDTLSTKGGFDFDPLPQFQPEIFGRVRPLKFDQRKGFDKGLQQLVEEGTVQLLRQTGDASGRPIVAGVGKLQFEVLQYRLEHEYGVPTAIDALGFECSAWLVGDPSTFKKPSGALVVQDRRDRLVVLFSSKWEKAYAAKENPQHQFLDMA